MKYKVGASLLAASILLAGCGAEDNATSTEKTENVTEQTTKQVTTATTLIDERLKEPAKDERCAFCNMMVYGKDHKFGAFTAQAIDEEGNNLFFDDAGCMLNYEREHNVTLEKFVRDYDSKEWMTLDDAVIVQADIKTPMHYGFAYFDDDKSADQFIDAHEASKVVTVDAIDDKAHEKMKMKMNKEHDGESMHNNG